MRSLSVGEVISRKYEIVRVIGEGGMGVVYEAQHLRLGNRVALKMLHGEVGRMPELAGRFDREAQAAARLRSEHVARVLDVDTAESGAPYIVMELLTGHDLEREIEMRGALPLAEAVQWVRQACVGIAHAHQSGIVHRDLKPANLFLSEGASGDRCLKVLDFGISKLMDGPGASVTQTGAAMGTPLYMSPEQIRSPKYVDVRTDVWSLGVIFYELLTGRAPFQGDNSNAVLASIIADAFVPPSVLVPQLGPEVDRIVARALEKERDKRYSDVREFDLALAGLKLSALPVSSPRSSARAYDDETRSTTTAVATDSVPSVARPLRTWMWVAVLAVTAGVAVGLLAMGPPKPAVLRPHMQRLARVGQHAAFEQLDPRPTPTVAAPVPSPANTPSSQVLRKRPPPNPKPPLKNPVRL